MLPKPVAAVCRTELLFLPAPAPPPDLEPSSRFLLFLNDTATTEIYTLSLHDALPICDGDIGPQRYAREHQNAARIQDGAARAADPLVAGEQGSGVLALDRLREEARVDIAERGFEAVGQSFDQDAEQGLGAGLLEQVSRQLRGWLPGDAQAKYFARGSLTRSTSQ